MTGLPAKRPATLRVYVLGCQRLSRQYVKKTAACAMLAAAVMAIARGSRDKLQGNRTLMQKVRHRLHG